MLSLDMEPTPGRTIDSKWRLDKRNGTRMIKVEVFSSPGCGKCSHARDVLRRLAAELGGIEWREVNVLDEFDYAVRLGVLSTPAIAVNGRLVFTTLPSAKKLRAALEEEIRNGYLQSPARK